MHVYMVQDPNFSILALQYYSITVYDGICIWQGKYH